MRLRRPIQKANIKQRFPSLSSLGPITTPYGGQTRGEPVHPGVDIAFQKGTPIPSPVGGKVLSVVNGQRNGDNGFGNMAVVQAPNGDTLQYGHLERVNVQPGQTIQKGQNIGLGGNSGNSYSPSGNGDGSHLDFRVVDAYKKYKNPRSYL